jgi:hypothetical protein
MDIEMKAEETTPDYPIWDLKTEGGIVPIISGDKEDVQTASLACFLEKGTIPQLPEAGVEWTKFLTDTKTFGELDAEIRESLRKAGMVEFQPNYQIDGDRLTLAVSKEIS